MGRTTLTRTSRGWVRRLIVATAVTAAASLALPAGVAVAAQPAVSASPALRSLLENAGPGGGGGGDEAPSNPNPGGSDNPDQPKPDQSSQDQASQQQKDAAEKAKKEQQEQQEKKDAAAKAKKEAEEKAEAERKAAEAAARERARAAKRAAQLAAATKRARTSWNTHARPERMVIVRSRTIDVVTNGSLNRQVPRSPGSVTMADLDRALPSNWLSITSGTAQVTAAIVLSPGVLMDIGGGDIREVKLAGGTKPTQAASIYTGSGKLRLRGATVSSFDPGTGAAMPVGPGRPFIVVSSNGQFDASDATISDLGSAVTEPNGRPGVLFGINSSGSVLRSTLTRNSTGLMLDRSNGIKLQDVSVTDSSSDGLVLRGDKATTLGGIKAERNGGNGVLVTGESQQRPITGIATNGNTGFGLAVTKQEAPKIYGITASGDQAGGVRLSRSANATVTDVVVSDAAIGVLAHAGATRATLDRLRIINSRRGVVLDKSVTGVTVNGSTIEGSDVVAVGVAGKQVTLTDLGIRDSGTAVRIERGSIGIAATGLTITGGKDGVISTPGTTGLTLQNLVADGVSSTAVRTFTPEAQITGGRITGSGTGIDAGAATTITGTTITQVDLGIRSRSTDLVRAENIDISAINAGIDIADGSPFVLTGSRIDALEAVHGELRQGASNELSLPPLNLLGAIGVPLILLALVLEQVNAFRQRGLGVVRRRLPPSLPAGAGG